MLELKYIPFRVLFFSSFLAACSYFPTAELESAAKSLGADIEYLETGLPQVIVYKDVIDASDKGVLHIYIGGDGLPMVNGGQLIASDPTVFDEIVLSLFALDASPRLFMGRPCYYRMSYTPLCDVSLWTTARYSEKIIQAMHDQISVFLERHSITDVVLIGFSGGGSLSVLLAERISEVSKVVSIAGNIDIDAWVGAHGYSPLEGSLNPKDHFRTDIPYWLLVGGEDQNVSLGMYAEIRPQANIKIIEVEDYTHQCCWGEFWPSLLNEL